MQNESYTTIEQPIADMEFLIRLNMMLTTNYNHRTNMDTALKMIGSYIRYDRVHILEVHHNMTASILHEWCGKDISPIRDKFNHHQLLLDKSLEQQLEDQNYIIIKINQDLDNPVIRETLYEYTCQNVILFPLFASESQFAFIAFTECRQCHDCTSTEIRLMNALASIISANLDKNIFINKLLHHLSREKERGEEIELLHARLKQLHQNLMPEWKSFKKNLNQSDSSPVIPSLDTVEDHINTLDRICCNLSLK